MSTRSQSSMNPTLTNYARGLAPQMISEDAKFFAPDVQVSATIGQYKSFSDKNSFQVFETARATGGSATRIRFDLSDATYNCKPNALEIAIDDSERDSAGDDQLGLEQSKVSTLMGSAHLSHLNKVIATINAGVSAVAGKGVWSSSSNDPIKEINAQIVAIGQETGMLPTSLGMSLSAWNTFAEHPLVTARIKSGVAVIRPQDVVNLFMIPLEIKIFAGVKDSAKAGNTKNTTFVMGSDVYLFIKSPMPTVYDPGFAKSFKGGRYGIDSVRLYRDETARSDILAIDWSVDVKVVGTAAVRRLTLS